MEILVQKKYGLRDLGSDIVVQELIKNINIVDTDITLNLNGCLIDYVATSKIIDHLLKNISLRSSGKLKIVTDFILPKTVLLTFLLWGSDYFDIPMNTRLNEIEKKINEKLYQSEIELIIESGKGTNKVKYNYNG